MFARRSVCALTRSLPLLVGLLASLSAGCETTPARTGGTLRYSEDSKRTYERAMKQLKERDYLEAGNSFREVRRRFAFSTYAPLSQLRLADIDFEQEHYAEAIAAYKVFLRENPKHPQVGYAKMRIARGTFAEITDAPLLPSPEERDQAPVYDAYREINAYLRDYPDGPEVEHMRALQGEVLGRLVGHELYVARYYAGRDKPQAALARVTYATTKYRGSKRDVEALILQAEILLMLKRKREAKDTLQRTIDGYPNDPRTAQARAYLEQLRREPD